MAFILSSHVPQSPASPISSEFLPHASCPAALLPVRVLPLSTKKFPAFIFKNFFYVVSRQGFVVGFACGIISVCHFCCLFTPNFSMAPVPYSLIRIFDCCQGFLDLLFIGWVIGGGSYHLHRHSRIVIPMTWRHPIDIMLNDVSL